MYDIHSFDTYIIHCIDEQCCNLILFFFILILSLQLYTCIQPSSVPNHIVGCRLSLSSDESVLVVSGDLLLAALDFLDCSLVLSFFSLSSSSLDELLLN